jgi:hypothetical protein
LEGVLCKDDGGVSVKADEHHGIDDDAHRRSFSCERKRHQLQIMQVQRSKCKYVGGRYHFHPFISFSPPWPHWLLRQYLRVSERQGQMSDQAGKKCGGYIIRNQKRLPRKTCGEA